VAYLAGVWDYSTSSVVADPGSGKVAADDAGTTLSISTTTNNATDVSASLAELAVGDRIMAQQVNDAANYAVHEVTVPPFDHGTWWEVPVSTVTSGTAPNKNTDIQLVFDHVVAPPGPEPFHAYATVDDLAAALHLSVTTKNEAALQRALNAAATEIDHDVDRVDVFVEPYPDAIVQANIALAVEAYKLPDSAFGVLGFDDSGAIRTAKDTVPRYWQLLTPYKQRWGIA
jgi:hypothetical protein